MLLDSSWYICLCGSTSIDVKLKLPSTLGPSNFQRLGDLYFCPTCQVIKCIHCCRSKIECKYCVNCMSDYTDNLGMVRCLKNCFECPQCFSPLNVSVEDATIDTAKGKRFTFKCGFCDYKYHTQVVTKPAALSAIVKGESDPRFAQLHERYTLLQKLQQVEEKQAVPKVSEVALRRMKAMDIKHPKNLVEIDKLTEKLATSLTEELKDMERNDIKLPLGKQLVAKISHACNICKAPLMVPVADHRLMKILSKEYASDIVPRISAKVSQKDVRNFSAHSDTQCVLSLVNVTGSSVNVTVSVVSQLPTKHMSNNAEIAVSLPTTHFSIQGRREKQSAVDSVPTPYLTSNTKMARAEQLTRAARREAQKRDNTENTMEIGPNWVSVPFTVTNNSENALAASASVPFYITVELKLPDTWKPQKGRRGLKYGIWVVCQIES